MEYKFLKAVIEGGVETKPDNILLYATSNRRNLIRETWKDRADMEHENDVHHSDTLEEKLSLSARFGVRINYSIPNRTQFQEMVRTLAQRQGLTVPAEVLLGGGQQVGTAPRRRLRPHGPASLSTIWVGPAPQHLLVRGTRWKKENLLPREKHLFEEGLKARPLLSEKQGEVAL